MKKLILFIVFSVFLVACSDAEPNKETPPTTKPTAEETNDQTNPDSEIKNIDVTKFFLPDGSKAYFLGEGNEFATFTVETKWISDDYVALVEDNGGATILKIYRLMDEEARIVKVLEEIIDGLPEDIVYPTLEELGTLPVIEDYFKGPIEVGHTFGNWRIVDITTHLETPYQSFENVIVLEETTEDFINRKYFAEGFGEVKRESIMYIEGEDDFIVTSTLEKIENN